MLVAKLEVLGHVDRRGAIRFDINAVTTVRGADDRPLDVQVEDFSRTGFRFAVDAEIPVDTLVSLGLSGAGARLASVVWRDGNSHGCMFLEPLTQDEIARAFTGQEARVADIAAALERQQRLAEARKAVPPEPATPEPVFELPPEPAPATRTRLAARLLRLFHRIRP